MTEREYEPDGIPGWLRNILWLVVLAGGLWFAANIQNTIIVSVSAWLIAYLLNPAVEVLEGQKLGPIKKCSRNMAIGIIFTFLCGLGIAFMSWMIPEVTHQLGKLVAIQDVISQPDELKQQLETRANAILDTLKIPEESRGDLQERAMNSIRDGASQIGRWVGKALQYLANFFGQLVSGFVLFLTALLFSVYLLQDWPTLGHGMVDFLPPNYRDDAEALSAKMNEIFGGYLKATILTSVAVSIATFITLLVIKLATGAEFPYLILVSVVAGITYPIPVLGIVGTSILGGVLGFLPENNLGFAVAVLVGINVVNSLIDRTVQPKLMGDAIGVSPLFVMFAAFAGGELAGIWGMLLGIPVAAMAKALMAWFHGRFLIWPEMGLEAAAEAASEAQSEEGSAAAEPAPEIEEPSAEE